MTRSGDPFDRLEEAAATPSGCLGVLLALFALELVDYLTRRGRP